MVFIEVEGDPPNKQQAAYKRKVEPLKEALVKAREDSLNSVIISDPVSIEVNLYTTNLRYVREGHDNTYIGDLDNLLSGILDVLEGIIINNDSQVKSIVAVKNVIEEEVDTRYTVSIIKATEKVKWWKKIIGAL
jgi:Holliday junction resolvase RusA-like endonuclease